MKAEELRIGNLVFVPKTKQIIPITAINMHVGVVVNNSLSWLSFDEITPVKLTNDILLSFGAKEIDTHTYELSRFKLKWMDGYQYYYVTDFHSLTYLTKIDTVNELQNFYHSMQGGELKKNIDATS